MSYPPAEEIRITYTTADVDLSAFHHYFDEALAAIREDFGAERPIFIGGNAISVDSPLLVDTSPINTDWTLGRFQGGTAAEVDRAVEVASDAQKAWAAMPWLAEKATKAYLADNGFDDARLDVASVGLDRRPESLTLFLRLNR